MGSWRTIFKQLENQQLQHPFQTTGDQATTTTIRGTTIFKEQGTDQQRTQQQEAQQQKQQVIKFFTMLHCPFPVPDQTYVIRQRIAGATSSSVQSRHHLPELHIQVHFQETDVSVARTLWLSTTANGFAKAKLCQCSGTLGTRQMLSDISQQHLKTTQAEVTCPTRREPPCECGHHFDSTIPAVSLRMPSAFCLRMILPAPKIDDGD